MGGSDVFLGNFSPSVTEDDLRDIFEGFDVLDIRIINKDGKVFGFASFSNDEDAERAANEKHNTELQGRRLVCRFGGDKKKEGRRDNDGGSRPRRDRNEDEEHGSGDGNRWNRGKESSGRSEDQAVNWNVKADNRSTFGQEKPPPLGFTNTVKAMPPLYVDDDLFKLYEVKYLAEKQDKIVSAVNNDNIAEDLAQDFQSLDLSGAYMVFVSNFPFHTYDHLILNLFSAWNPIAFFIINNGRPHDDPTEVTEAHVYFATERDMLAAVSVNGTFLRGRPLAVIAQSDELYDDQDDVVSPQQFVSPQYNRINYQQHVGSQYVPRFKVPQPPGVQGYKPRSLLGTPPGAPVRQFQTPYRPRGGEYAQNFTPFNMQGQFRGMGRY